MTREQQADRRLLLAAFHALRSYEYGNASPDLAKDVADRIEAQLREDRAVEDPSAHAQEGKSYR